MEKDIWLSSTLGTIQKLKGHAFVKKGDLILGIEKEGQKGTWMELAAIFGNLCADIAIVQYSKSLTLRVTSTNMNKDTQNNSATKLTTRW